MIPYSRDSHEKIPASAVKIIGLGGAGANMLERIAIDGIEGTELLALNTDIRTLNTCLAKDKIQLGLNLTKGLGTGGDPELGQQAMLEAENDVRTALKGQRIVFLCTGLGGGTGSGAAPIVVRIAREEGAFVVVFATMPFFFEGRRRREQAETSLNQLAVLSNALVTFDNNRMGELVLAKQGIHEAFAAADKMISESIKAVIRLVVRPGLINVGLDDLMSALRTTRSRCLFGSGLAEGKDRATKALRNALASPLLDQGSLLKEAQTVLVHLSGGENLTLYEIELLMQNLQKYVPEKAHVLFGAAIDPSMGEALSITLISALPEDSLTGGSRNSISAPVAELEPSEDFANFAPNDVEVKEREAPAQEKQEPEPEPQPEPEPETRPFAEPDLQLEIRAEEPAPAPAPDLEIADIEEIDDIEEPEQKTDAEPVEVEDVDENVKGEKSPFTIKEKSTEQEIKDDLGDIDSAATPYPGPKTRPAQKPLWSASKTADKAADETKVGTAPSQSLNLDEKFKGAQSELSFENAPRGRFEGENPNVFEGEDLDLPPFLRKKK